MVNNAAGTGAGMINDTGEGSYLILTARRRSTTRRSISARSDPTYLNENDPTGAGTVLTLGSNVTIDQSGTAVINS